MDALGINVRTWKAKGAPTRLQYLNCSGVQRLNSDKALDLFLYMYNAFFIIRIYSVLCVSQIGILCVALKPLSCCIVHDKINEVVYWMDNKRY
jgi:hypothetical protein